MTVTLFEDAATFAARARPVFEADPIQNNVTAVLLQHVLEGRPVDPTRWYLIEDDDGTAAGVAMHSDGNGLLMSPLPEHLRRPAADALAGLLAPWAAELPGANGPVAETDAFAQAWCAVHGGSPQVHMADWLYTIDHIPAGPKVPGQGRLSRESDVPQLTEYVAAFDREAHVGSVQRSPEQIENTVRRRPVFVWEADGQIASLAGLSGPAYGVGRIGPVYTPPQHRRRGFAAAVTAFAAAKSFARGGRLCMLFADQDNLTSNGVYSRLGFQLRHQQQMLAFR